MVDIKNKLTITQNTYFLGAAATNVMAACCDGPCEQKMELHANLTGRVGSGE